VSAHVPDGMEVPGIAAAALEEGEEVATSVALGGDDRLFVTPRRSLVYRSGGVLSDESVESLDHDVDRLTVSEGRRKATLGLEYAVGDDRELAVPLDRLEAVLQPVLAAVLRADGVTAPGERVHRVFSFSELTLVITDERLLKHVGAVLWDADHESIPFESVTDLAYEEGSVATGVVLTVDGRKERLKTPNDRLGEVREHLESALLAARGVDSVADLGDDHEDGDDGTDPDSAVADFGGVDALDAGGGGTDGPTARSGDRSAGDSVSAGREAVGPGGSADDDPDDLADAPAGDGGTAVETTGSETEGKRSDDAETADEVGDDGGPDTPFTEPVEPAAPEEAVREELSELRAAVERQNDLLRRHNDAIERLVETLRES